MSSDNGQRKNQTNVGGVLAALDNRPQYSTSAKDFIRRKPVTKPAKKPMINSVHSHNSEETSSHTPNHGADKGSSSSDDSSVLEQSTTPVPKAIRGRKENDNENDISVLTWTSPTPFKTANRTRSLDQVMTPSSEGEASAHSANQSSEEEGACTGILTLNSEVTNEIKLPKPRMGRSIEDVKKRMKPKYVGAEPESADEDIDNNRSLDSDAFSSENEFIDNEGYEDDEDEGSDEYLPDGAHGDDSFFTDGSEDLEIDEGVEEDEPEWARPRGYSSKSRASVECDEHDRENSEDDPTTKSFPAPDLSEAHSDQEDQIDSSSQTSTSSSKSKNSETRDEEMANLRELESLTPSQAIERMNGNSSIHQTPLESEMSSPHQSPMSSENESTIVLSPSSPETSQFVQETFDNDETSSQNGPSQLLESQSDDDGDNDFVWDDDEPSNVSEVQNLFRSLNIAPTISVQRPPQSTCEVKGEDPVADIGLKSNNVMNDSEVFALPSLSLTCKSNSPRHKDLINFFPLDMQSSKRDSSIWPEESVEAKAPGLLFENHGVPALRPAEIVSEHAAPSDPLILAKGQATTRSEKVNDHIDTIEPKAPEEHLQSLVSNVGHKNGVGEPETQEIPSLSMDKDVSENKVTVETKDREPSPEATLDPVVGITPDDDTFDEDQFLPNLPSRLSLDFSAVISSTPPTVEGTTAQDEAEHQNVSINEATRCGALSTPRCDTCEAELPSSLKTAPSKVDTVQRIDYDASTVEQVAQLDHSCPYDSTNDNVDKSCSLYGEGSKVGNSAIDDSDDETEVEDEEMAISAGVRFPNSYGRKDIEEIMVRISAHETDNSLDSEDDVVAVVVDDDSLAEGDSSGEMSIVAAVVVDEAEERDVDEDDIQVLEERVDGKDDGDDDASANSTCGESVTQWIAEHDPSLERDREGQFNTTNMTDMGSEPEDLPGSAETGSPTKTEPQRRTQKAGVSKGKWTLGSKIGAGTFGEVRMGMNTVTGTLMAVKSIKMEKAVRNDVRREIDLLRSLEHRNIVRYYGAESDRSHIHIFQEWVPGGCVASLLKKFGAFSMPVVKIYLAQILAGLSYLHENNILHRDIKGSNVLVSDAGVVKLADFGASKKCAAQDDMLMTMTLRGTPYFMAPEVFSEKYSFQADVWAVGCVAYQMATGTQPWKGLGLSNPISLYNYVKSHDGPPPLDSVRESTGYTPAFEEVLRKCFNRDPHLRPSSAALQEDVFFLEARGLSEDDNTATPKSFFSSGNRSSSLWDNFHSPPTTNCPHRLRLRRIGSLSSLRSPLLSPPIPKQVEPAALQRPISPLPPSPYDKRQWPSWARGELYSKKKSKASPLFLSVDGLGQTQLMMSSLAISEDSKTINRNLFRREGPSTRNSDHFSDVSESLSLLRGELLSLGESRATKGS